MAKERRVVYTLDIETGKGNASAAKAATDHFKEVERAARAAQKAVNDANSAASRGGRGGAGGKAGGFSAGYDKAARAEMRQALADERRENEATIRANLASQKQAEKEAAAAKKATAKDVLATQKAAAKEAADFEKQMARQVSTLGKQYGDRERLGKQADAATTKAWKDAGQAVGAATGAVVAYGRAVVLATAADEESSQRMLQKIARFEAFASVLTGTVSLVKAGTSAWKAYQAAAAAAAIAQGAGGAARVGAGGLLAGGLAAGAGKIGGAVAGAASNPLTGVAMVTAGVLSAGYSVTRAVQAGKSAKQGLMDTGNFLLEGMTEFLGITDRAGDAAKAWKERMSNGRLGIDAAGQKIIAREEWHGSRSAIDRERAMLTGGGRAALASTRNSIQALEQRQDLLPNYASTDSRQAIAESLAQYRRQEIDDVKEIARVELEAKREKIDGEKQALGILRDRLKESSRAVQDARNATKSAKVRFGMMDESEQMMTLAAVRKLENRQPLNRQDEERLRNIGGTGTTYADESAARRADKAGFGDIKKTLLDPVEFKARAMANNVSAKVDIKHDVVMRLEADAKLFEKSMTDAAMKVYDKMIKDVDAKLEAANRRIDSELALQRGTAGG